MDHDPSRFTDLDPPDLNLHPSFPAEPAFRPSPLDQDVHFRHSGWLRDRHRVYRALNVVFPSSTRTERFAACGSNAWVIRNEDQPDLYAIASDHCHDRFCRPCSAFRSRVIAGNVSAYLRRRPFRFLTLTIKTTNLTLKEGVDKLYRSFGALRRTKLWASKVTGGCAVCEVKPKAGGVGWHPHLHAVIEGRYLPLKAVRKHWLRITKDSFIVDIQFGRDAEKAAQYISKYITKPFDDGTIRQPHRLEDAIRALHGRRLVITFGRWRGQRLTEYNPTSTWTRVGPLALLRSQAKNGLDTAVELYDYLLRTRAFRNVPAPRPRAPPEDPNASRTNDDREPKTRWIASWGGPSSAPSHTGLGATPTADRSCGEARRVSCTRRHDEDARQVGTGGSEGTSGEPVENVLRASQTTPPQFPNAPPEPYGLTGEAVGESSGIGGGTTRESGNNAPSILTGPPGRTSEVTRKLQFDGPNADSYRPRPVSLSRRPIRTTSDEFPGDPFSEHGSSWVESCRALSSIERLRYSIRGSTRTRNDNTVAGEAGYARFFTHRTLPTSHPSVGGLRPPSGDPSVPRLASPAPKRGGVTPPTPLLPPPCLRTLKSGPPASTTTAKAGRIGPYALHPPPHPYGSATASRLPSDAKKCGGPVPGRLRRPAPPRTAASA